MLTDLQSSSIKSIVNIFETGRAHGEYGRVTLLSGDAGHLTYGRSQTTLTSGNLHLLIKTYCDQGGAAVGERLRPFLQRLSARDLSLDLDLRFKDLLANAGGDPVMREVQDRFFDRVYWKPAVDHATAIQITSALGVAVVYDSCIHGSWFRLRDQTSQKHNVPKEIGEQPWVESYVKERREWLATHPNTLLRRTVYRMDTFQNLIKEKKWNLTLPITVRGISLTPELLQMQETIVASAQDAEERVLLLQTPRMKGSDVLRVQKALIKFHFVTSADGAFGPQTAQAVALFQQSKGMRADGIVGPATYAALGL